MSVEPSAAPPVESSVEETVDRFFTAVQAGDVETVRALYAEDVAIWHNDDLVEETREQNLAVLKGLHATLGDLRYDIVRRAVVEDGVIQQHVLSGTLPDGSRAELHAAIYLQVRDDRITRIEEYFDSGRRARIKEAREAQMRASS